MGSRPDCAYFLLLGLCLAAFLMTIGGILTYVAFNPGSIDGHPHSALSHIPHFHHHGESHIHHHAHHPTQNYQTHHHPGGSDPHHPTQHHYVNNHTLAHNSTTTTTTTTTTTNISEAAAAAGSSNLTTNSSTTTTPKSTLETSTNGIIHHAHPPPPPPPPHHHDPTLLVHPTSNSSAVMQSAYEAKAKQSLVLAIIGPLCLLMGIVVTLIVGVLALKYDCDHEPEPNISFLRLRSEMSLNYDPDKNNYELLRPSSTIGEAGGHFSINPTGLPVESS